ncbi:hypothetical protein OF377_01410 [Ureaplasma sp. ES3154-GEN]|uniref:hypothetical protein n=1 Tax=Ureaplasma sp. ES3154-GEN TaxID=2984844 RepID=UPI0021E86E0B|nr:hypothetical protein [Ureaplasma sp. ES3154-GEN]MCV3743545.1 hypothetical protein [Ureaplasma sp. ES3154-GEN]
MKSNFYNQPQDVSVSRLVNLRTIGLWHLILLPMFILGIILFATSFLTKDLVSTVSMLGAGGFFIGMYVVASLILKIMYIVKLHSLKLEEFKIWWILLLVGLLVSPLLYFVAWIKTLNSLKKMIDEQ